MTLRSVKLWYVCFGAEEAFCSKVAKAYRPVLHEFEAGAEVGQADVAVHIQQDVVGLDVPEGGHKKKNKESVSRVFTPKTRNQNRKLFALVLWELGIENVHMCNTNTL